MLKYEKDLYERGFHAVCGIDEAGCGPLAGPVYAAAVILEPDDPIEGVNDSKKLSPKKREELFDEIVRRARAFSIAFADEKEIDSINILQARLLAMRRAVEGLEIKPDYALVDGNRDPGLSIPTSLIIKGDSLSASIAAASILAKVERDRVMTEAAEKYPEYQFDKHKGYPTALHYELIRKYGPCPIHRVSFLKKFYETTAGR